MKLSEKIPFFFILHRFSSFLSNQIFSFCFSKLQLPSRSHPIVSSSARVRQPPLGRSSPCPSHGGSPWIPHCADPLPWMVPPLLQHVSDPISLPPCVVPSRCSLPWRPTQAVHGTGASHLLFFSIPSLPSAMDAASPSTRPLHVVALLPTASLPPLFPHGAKVPSPLPPSSLLFSIAQDLASALLTRLYPAAPLCVVRWRILSCGNRYPNL
jgi:hypothetical protein